MVPPAHRFFHTKNKYLLIHIPENFSTKVLFHSELKKSYGSNDSTLSWSYCVHGKIPQTCCEPDAVLDISEVQLSKWNDLILRTYVL